eukprot:scaffold17.g496.t1
MKPGCGALPASPHAWRSAVFAEQRLLVAGDGRPERKPDMQAPAPPAVLLGRLQAFLPQLQAANAQLEQAPAEALVMEHARRARIADDERAGPYVELDLACGLFDLKDETALAAAERSLANGGVAVERFGGSSGSDDSSSEEEDEGEEEEEEEAERHGQEMAEAGPSAQQQQVERSEAGDRVGASGSAASGRQLKQRQRQKQQQSKRRPKIEELS